VYDLRTHSSKLVFTADTIWEAPNWSPDGKYLISNSGGLIYKLVFKADGGVQTPEKLNVPHDYECNNDKAISPETNRNLKKLAGLGHEERGGLIATTGIQIGILHD
jgi:hypothetical protein